MNKTHDLERLRVSMVVSEIDSARDVLTCLDDVDATVEPATMDVSDPSQRTVRIDLEKITVKQWETLVLAHERGYYRSPRETDLTELAEELSLSKSAVSQRLRGAEATAIESILSASGATVIEG